MATEGTRFRDVQVCYKSTEIKQGAVMSASAKEWVCVCMAGWEGGALALAAHASHLAQQPPYLITKTLAH